MPSLGTRQRQTSECERLPQSNPNTNSTRDVGMTKNVTAAITFTAGNGRATAANGTFSAFAVNDPVEIWGTHQNDGFFTVTGIDAVNGSYLVLDPPPPSNGPVNATIRTI